jgi:hypothetical protein
VGQAAGGQRQHHLVDAGQAPLPLAYDLRLEAALAIPWHLKFDRADVGDDGLRACSVAGVARSGPGFVVFFVAEVVGELAFQGGLQDLLRQLLQQPALAGQFDALSAGAVDQLPDQLLVQRVGLPLDRLDFLNRLRRGDHIAHQLFFLDRELHR